MDGESVRGWLLLRLSCRGVSCRTRQGWKQLEASSQTAFSSSHSVFLYPQHLSSSHTATVSHRYSGAQRVMFNIPDSSSSSDNGPLLSASGLAWVARWLSRYPITPSHMSGLSLTLFFHWLPQHSPCSYGNGGRLKTKIVWLCVRRKEILTVLLNFTNVTLESEAAKTQLGLHNYYADVAQCLKLQVKTHA